MLRTRLVEKSWPSRPRHAQPCLTFASADPGFGMGIPEEKPINPFGNTDWEGVGVEPDVKVKAANTLETSVKLAKAKLEKN
jgi:hypothetical protein